ncbi:MAG TPA: hypothetical protein VGO22_15485 [Pseudorhizobium sp.]|jgi:hypothetical protein|nr:hypothetical protein [Pseudorhizobium sp.]
MNVQALLLAPFLATAALGLSACNDESQVQEETEIERTDTGEPVRIESAD